MHYGYSLKSVYNLMEKARKHDEREREGRERELYDGTLEMRTRIAATPGTTRTVGDAFGVSHVSVAKWRRLSLTSTQIGQ
ncbi:MAG TPA: hypothetical protein VGG41_07070 [Solirubrobacteraceae bacterium]|jgi:hypothetical protein